jgi:SHS2 domain-containing protein
MRARSHEILPHPSDVGLRASGPDRSGAFAEAVAALGEILAGAPVAGREPRPIHVDGGDADEQLMALLSEGLYELDAHGWLAGGAELTVGEGFVAGWLLGEAFDADRHGDGVHVKAITWHDLAVEEDAEGAVVTVFVDI